MSRSDNADRGLVAERYTCEKWGLEHRANELDAEFWLDARVRDDIVTPLGTTVVSAETPVDTKSCWRSYDDGRCGRIKIKKSNHERLLEANGEYAIVVIENGTTEVLRASLTSAETVDCLIDNWWPSGRSCRDDGPFVQLPWSRFFDDLEVDAGDSA